jgi:hypothetical protein
MMALMKYNAAQTACETFAWEVEDYTVNIGTAPIAGFAAVKTVDLPLEMKILFLI